MSTSTKLVDAIVVLVATKIMNDRLKNTESERDLGKAKETGTAEFFVLLSGGAGTPAKAEAVKFVSGDEKLKIFTDALRTAEYRLAFPDDAPLKILRRGILSCPATTGNCTFVLMLPDDVRTVD